MFIDYSRFKMFFMFFILFSFSLSSNGNRSTEKNICGKFFGYIKDSNGPIEGAELEIVELEISVKSKENGHFFFKDIPIGEYTIKICKAGYETYKYEHLIIKQYLTSVIGVYLPRENQIWDEVKFVESEMKYIETYEELERIYPDLLNLESYNTRKNFRFPGFYKDSGNIRFMNFPYPAIFYMIIDNLKQAFVLNFISPSCKMYPHYYTQEKLVYNISPGKHHISFYDEDIEKICSIEIVVFEEKTTFIDFNVLKKE